MYKNIIFDADGTLINSFEGIFKGINYVLREVGESELSAEEIKKFVGPALAHSFREFLHFDEEKVEKSITLYRDYYALHGVFECELYDGIKELIEQLHADGKILSVATSKPQKFIEIILKNKGLDKYFTVISGADMSEKHSGKKELIQAAICDENAVMVGDRYFDIEGAKNAGIDSIGVLYGFCADGEFEKYVPTHIAKDTTDIYNIVTKK